MAKYRIRVTLQYEEEFEAEGTYQEADEKAEKRRERLRESMAILGVIDEDNLLTLTDVYEIDETPRDSKSIF